ncbi:hypothetical protein ACFOY2_28240 [Nonomuraea purpurea]|uniref:Uncharacterized protein n=1 Tax=Nonomuraea purpurea TaxID=1849276 RepID=A0ABV8GAZ5_9ACTN
MDELDELGDREDRAGQAFLSGGHAQVAQADRVVSGVETQLPDNALGIVVTGPQVARPITAMFMLLSLPG